MYLVGLGHVHEGGVKGDLLFFLGTENGSQVYGLFHGTDEFFPAIHVSGIVDLADPNKDVGNIKSVGVGGCHGKKYHVSGGNVRVRDGRPVYIPVVNVHLLVREGTAVPLIQHDFYEFVFFYPGGFCHGFCRFYLFIVFLPVLEGDSI